MMLLGGTILAAACGARFGTAFGWAVFGAVLFFDGLLDRLGFKGEPWSILATLRAPDEKEARTK